MKYSVHPHAEKELEEVENYYDNIREELGNRFRDEFQEAISQILKFPNGWQPLSQVVRRCSLNTFLYGIGAAINFRGIAGCRRDAETRSSLLTGNRLLAVDPPKERWVQ